MKMLSKLIQQNYNEYIKEKISNQKGYKMKKENFGLWLEYLATHPQEVTYENFKKFIGGK